MDDFHDSPVTIHSIVISAPHGPLSITLSHEYNIEFERKLIRITATGRQKMPSSLERNIASFHTLFGINGSGKTDILLRLAEGFGQGLDDKNISVHYSRNGQLFLYVANAFKKHQIVGSTDTVITDEFPHLSSIFYTSSPYESARRATVVDREGCFDVSPRYGGINQLDGLALLAFQQELPGQFIKHAKMGISLNLLTMSEICERLSDINRLTVDNDSGDITADVDAGSILRDLLYRGTNETLRDESLRLRVLCSMADKTEGDPKLARVWPRELAKIMVNLVKKQLPNVFRVNENVGVRQIPFQVRQPILIEIGKNFFSKLKNTHSNALGMVQTLEALSSWLTARKKGVIQATPNTFETNLKKYLSDRESLHRCSELGLAVFSITQLSSGETAIAVFSAALYGVLKKLNDSLRMGEPFLLLIDEGEMFLHPKWQREYIGRILKLLSSFSKIASNAHVFITSHSLIIAADTPPNCLIDIDKLKTVNGFGLGPKSLLEKVYDVEDLSGAYTHPALAGLASYFEDDKQRITKEEALLTAKALADKNVREYLVKRIEEEGES